MVSPLRASPLDYTLDRQNRRWPRRKREEIMDGAVNRHRVRMAGFIFQARSGILPGLSCRFRRRIQIWLLRGTDSGALRPLSWSSLISLRLLLRTLEGRSAFCSHPAHVKIGTALFIPWEKVVVIDYVPKA
ncbi:hypothetical protein NC651_024856 [Populus alba x Populus x berolinensis]|nr:hypothetical protein NC651_024856 [Populus alba x Populus x berolinensis]